MRLKSCQQILVVRLGWEARVLGKRWCGLLDPADRPTSTSGLFRSLSVCPLNWTNYDKVVVPLLCPPPRDTGLTIFPLALVWVF